HTRWPRDWSSDVCSSDLGDLQFRTPLMIARTQLLITSEQSEARIADLVANATQQYWDAIQARDNIKVQQQAYDLAQKSYERDKQIGRASCRERVENSGRA